METKVLEVRDVGTFLPVIAIRLDPANEAERYLLARSGYGRTAQKQGTFIILFRVFAEDTPANYAAEAWGDRTMRVAHHYIERNWVTLTGGDVIDVQYILGETHLPKRPERETQDDNG